jgi:hypothetical protein
MYTPAIQRVRRIAAQERRQRFLGTDFTNEDMAERILDDFSYRLIGEGEVIDGRETWKIEARPVAADRSQYAWLYLWVPRDIPYATLIEMYDRQGQRLRILKASQLEKIAGIWVARNMEMASPVENTRTVLFIEEIRFNTGLKRISSASSPSRSQTFTDVLQSPILLISSGGTCRTRGTLGQRDWCDFAKAP